MQSDFVKHQDAPRTDLGNGLTRTVLAWLPQQMMVEVCFEEGAIGVTHSHPHTQCTYVLEGKFEFIIEGKQFTLLAGDTIAFAPDETHGCLCKQKGTLLDVFCPMREDFLQSKERCP